MNKKDQNQLTTKQANESRFVTKIRWVVEAVNGRIKTFRALNQIQNSMAQHSMQDWKIAAAFINCFYPPLESDGENALLVVNNMKEKRRTPNKLTHYLNLNWQNVKQNFKVIDEIELTDFPKIDLEDLHNRITCGSYGIKLSPYYISSHFKENGTYKIFAAVENSKDQKSKFKNLRVIHAEIRSRHINSTKYRLFIRYVPNSNGTTGIDAWICECFVGKRTVGCCAHIANVLFYFGYAKYLKGPLHLPGQRLNDIFIQIDKPTTLQSTTQTTKSTTQTTKSTTQQPRLSQRTKSLTQPAIQSTNNSIEIDHVDFEEIIETRNRNEKKGKETVLEKTDHLSSTMKHSLTFDKNDSNKQNKKQLSFDLNNFTLHIPNWGGKIVVVNQDATSRNYFEQYNQFNQLKITNTCTIDYFLLAIWYSSQLSDNCKLFLEKHKKNNKTLEIVERIITLIDQLQWDRAKTIWILEMLKIQPDSESNTFSLFGSEYESIIKHFTQFQKVSYICLNCKKSARFPHRDFSFSKNEQNRCDHNISMEKKCNYCVLTINPKFENPPPFIFFETLNINNLTELNVNDFPLIINIDNLIYKLLCCSIHYPSPDDEETQILSHFKAIFRLNDTFFEVDDLDRSKKLKTISLNHITSTVFYYLA